MSSIQQRGDQPLLVQQFNELYTATHNAMVFNRNSFLSALSTAEKYLGKNTFYQEDKLSQPLDEKALYRKKLGYGSAYHFDEPETKTALAILTILKAREIVENRDMFDRLPSSDDKEKIRLLINLHPKACEGLKDNEFCKSILAAFPNKITQENITAAAQTYTL